jgi:hypothetical protein
MRDLPDIATSTVAAPALGYSITANLDGSRQIVVQCFTDGDESLEATHAKIDRAMAVVDRQKARYQIVDLRKERAQLVDELAQGAQDLAEVDLNFVKAQAGLDVQAGELNRQAEEVFKQAYEAHDRTGRTGKFKLVGHAKANTERVQAALDQVAALKAKNEAEREQHRQGFQISQQRREARVALLDGEIATLEGLIAGG